LRVGTKSHQIPVNVGYRDEWKTAVDGFRSKIKAKRVTAAPSAAHVFARTVSTAEVNGDSLYVCSA
jgi:hypothetical protein